MVFHDEQCQEKGQLTFKLYSNDDHENSEKKETRIIKDLTRE